MDKKYDFFDPDYFEYGFPYEDLESLAHNNSMLERQDEKTGNQFWFALDYKVIQEISADYKSYSSAEKTILIDTPEGDELNRQRNFLLNMDPPRHKRMRDIFSKAFTNNNIKQHEKMINEVIERVFSSLREKAEIEVVRDFSTPIALEVISRIMGISTDDMDFINNASNSMVYSDDPDFNADENNNKYSATLLFFYAMKLYQNRNKVEEGTLLHILCNSLDEGVDNLSQDEFCFFFVFILAAGYETTRSMISNMLRIISTNTLDLENLRNQKNIENAVEEFLRFDPPVFQMCRTATKDVEISGCPISAGDKIGLLYPAANRDSQVFEQPNVFDFERENAKKHLSFGIGRHHCLGASLARLELKLVLERFLIDYDGIELIKLERVRSNFINSIKSMTVKLKPRASKKHLM